MLAGRWLGSLLGDHGALGEAVVPSLHLARPREQVPVDSLQGRCRREGRPVGHNYLGHNYIGHNCKADAVEKEGR